MEAAQQARNDRNALVRAERERLSPDYSQRLQELSAKMMALRKTEVEIATLVQERQMLDATVREVEARLSDNDAVRAADARFIDALCAHDPEARAIIAEREAVVRRLQALDAASNR